MGEFDSLVEKLQAYVDVVSNRGQDRNTLRLEGQALLQTSFKHTEAFLEELLSKAGESLDASELQSRTLRKKRYREQFESKERLKDAATRRGVALANFWRTLSIQDHE